MRKDKGKEVCTEVWCIRFKVVRHHKDQCPVFNDNIHVGGPSSLKSVVRLSGTHLVWCVIYQYTGLHSTYCGQRIGKYMLEIKQLFCRLCSSLGHDEQHRQSFDLIDRKSVV